MKIVGRATIERTGDELLAAASRIRAKYCELGIEIEKFNELASGANWHTLGPAGADAVIVPPGDEWVSAREAAEVARRSIDCIHLWRTHRKIRAQKRAGRWEIDLQSLRAHIKENQGRR